MRLTRVVGVLCGDRICEMKQQKISCRGNAAINIGVM